MGGEVAAALTEDAAGRVLGETVAAPPGELAADALPALEGKALHATLWTVLDYGAGQALRVANSMLLTRLLLPSALGEMRLVTTLTVGIALLSDIGLAPSIIQSRRGDDERFLNTAWTLQAMRGGILWIAALLLAWPASQFYHDRTLLWVLPVLSFNSILTGLNSTSLLTLSRHMGVRRLFGIDFSTQIITMMAAVGWALWRPSVWALVVGNLAGALFRLSLSHTRWAVPGIRNRLCWDRDCLREILGFGKWIVIGTAFTFFATQADGLILGKLVGMGVLGLYGIAFQISDVPRSVISAFSWKVGYPFVAKIIDRPMPEFRVQFLRYRRWVLLVGAVLLSAMAVWGNLLILTFYPQRYSAAAWMVPVLALGLWHTLLYMTTGPVLLSLGKSRYNALGNGLYCAAMMLGIPLGFHFWGLPGAVVAVAAGDLPLYLVTQTGAVREGLRPLAQDAKLTTVFVGLLALEWGLRTWL